MGENSFQIATSSEDEDDDEEESVGMNAARSSRDRQGGLPGSSTGGRSAKVGQADPNMLLQLEMMKLMRKITKSGSSSEESESDGDTVGNGFKGVHKLRKRLRKKPGK
eukprot:6462742-Karenia_brevis.AAC.1